MMFRHFVLSACAIACLMCSCALAQFGGFNRPLQMKPKVKPSFHVTPMSQTVLASRGKILPIEFKIESIARPTTILVRTVSLKQDLDGTILPDTDSPAPDNLQLLTAAQMRLAENETKPIKCRLRVPTNQANFHSFGLLVTDLGRIVENRPIRAPDNTTRRVGIRFVTRYLLRVDVTIKGARGEDAAKIEVESVSLIEQDGLAKARVMIVNPTDSPLEFQVRSRLLRDGSIAGKNSFHLIMPSRATMESEDRINVRILPGARLRLEESLPEAVFPGKHQMELSFLTNRRTRKKSTYPILIGVNDFPAQNAAIVQAARDVIVSPAQAELSLRRGGKRRVSIEIQNRSAETVSIGVKPDNGSDFAPGLMIRTTKLEVRSGAKRKLLLTLDPRETLAKNMYSQLQLNIHAEDGRSIGSFSVPVAMLARSEESPSLEVGTMRWDGESRPPAFVLPVQNTGAMHHPLNAELKMVDAFGRTVQMQAGYGRWLVPGEETLLRFRTKFAPPPGKYQYQVRIEGSDVVDLIEVESEITFGDEGTELISITNASRNLQ